MFGKPKINVAKEHRTSVEEACARTRELVARFQEKNAALISDIKWSGDGRSADLSGSMFKARFAVDERRVTCDIELSLMAAPMKGMVEEKLKHQLDKAFPG
jgi:transcriptional regulator of aromatic amino acid metabolism